MKSAILAIAVLLAGCSASDSVSPEATASADAAASATASASTGSTDAPMTAEKCIEDSKGLGTGVRSENTKECMLSACDQGDKKSCDFVKSFSGDENGNEPPPEDEQGPAEQ